jgi:hypothetical protein
MFGQRLRLTSARLSHLVVGSYHAKQFEAGRMENDQNDM